MRQLRLYIRRYFYMLFVVRWNRFILRSDQIVRFIWILNRICVNCGMIALTLLFTQAHQYLNCCSRDLSRLSCGAKDSSSLFKIWARGAKQPATTSIHDVACSLDKMFRISRQNVCLCAQTHKHMRKPMAQCGCFNTVCKLLHPHGQRLEAIKYANTSSPISDRDRRQQGSLPCTHAHKQDTAHALSPGLCNNTHAEAPEQHFAQIRGTGLLPGHQIWAEE